MRICPRLQLLALSTTVLLALPLLGAEPASAETLRPWFHLASTSVPGNLEPESKDRIVVTAVNVGDASAEVEAAPLKIADVLPRGLRALSIEGNTTNNGGEKRGPVHCELGSLTCVFDEGCKPGECLVEQASLPPFEQVEVTIDVEVEADAESGELNEASVSGGGAPSVHIAHPIRVSESPTPFGVESYEMTPEEQGGVPDAQAGSHPFQLTTTLDLNQDLVTPKGSTREQEEPAEITKDLTFKLPAGLIGNPTAYPHCSLTQFSVEPVQCPVDTVLGTALVTFYLPTTQSKVTTPFSIYNLEPSVGEPARFAFKPGGVPVFLDTSVRTGEDYGVTVHVHNIPQNIGFLANTVTFWGTPGDSAHNRLRGEGCLQETDGEEPLSPCEVEHQSAPAPFLTMPTSCTGKPLETEVLADAWAEPTTIVPATPAPSQAMPTMDGCELLPFSSEIRVAPDLQAASTPSGLKVDVHVPQEEALTQKGLAPPDVKNIEVALPQGVALNPAAGDGLQACTEQQVGLANDDEEACPNASKIAEATIGSPLLPNPLTGFVYLASPQNFSTLSGAPQENPFASLVAMYLVVKDPVSGVLVKLAGSVSLSPSGQITSTFANNPQLPFEDAELHFFGGERGPLATPVRCGAYTTNAAFEPWSDTSINREILHSGSTFDIVSGPNGSPCPGAALAFAPSLASETTNINAGSFTPLSTTLSREDGEQNIQSVTLHYPPGVSGDLTGVPLCPEAQANSGTCSQASQIGETIVSVGLGGDPFSVTGGKVYITEKYDGAPFGLSIVNPAKAGPFDLQEGRPVVVRAKIEINPISSALTVTTDPSGPHSIPTVIEGIPLQIKHVNVLIDRPGFAFNPTNCNPMRIEGAVNSAEGASSPVSVPFQITDCAALKFAPKFAVSTSGKTSRTAGASLAVKLTYPSGSFGQDANIARVKVDLPRQLPSRLSTLKKACPAAQFEANPAGCPAESIVGHAKAVTPLIPVPLTGPAYFVSYAALKFPELIIVLQGYGVTLDLRGETYISRAGVTSSTFSTVPDAPVGSFELTLPEGRYSALAANVNLCKTALRMPTEFVAQDGAKIRKSTAVTVTGCGNRKVKRVGGHGKRKSRKK